MTGSKASWPILITLFCSQMSWSQFRLDITQVSPETGERKEAAAPSPPQPIAFRANGVPVQRIVRQVQRNGQQVQVVLNGGGLNQVFVVNDGPVLIQQDLDWRIRGDIARPRASSNARQRALSKAYVATLQIEGNLTAEQAEKLSLAGEFDSFRAARARDGGARRIIQNQGGLIVTNQPEKLPSMMTAVANRIWAKTQGMDFEKTRERRQRRSLQAALRLAITQLDQLTPLSADQLSKFDQWIKTAAASEPYTADMTYPTALALLLQPDNAPRILDKVQLQELERMRRNVTLGRFKPYAFVKTRQTLAQIMNQ